MKSKTGYCGLFLGGLALYSLYRYGRYKYSGPTIPSNSIPYSEKKVKKFNGPLSQQFLRVNYLDDEQKNYLTRSPGSFYEIFTGENKDNELAFAIRAIVKTRQLIPFASNRLDDYYAEMSHTKKVPPKNGSEDHRSVEARFQRESTGYLIDEHHELYKTYNFRKISLMDDKSISKLLSSGKKYHGVCVDMAKITMYHINYDENSEYISCKASFSNNKDLFPENNFFGMDNPKNLTTSNNHGFVLSFKKNNMPTKEKITWTDAVNYDAVIVDPWFKMAFKASDPNAIKYIYYSIKMVYMLEDTNYAQKYATRRLFEAMKKLDEHPNPKIDLAKLLEIDLKLGELKSIKKNNSSKQQAILNNKTHNTKGHFLSDSNLLIDKKKLRIDKLANGSLSNLKRISCYPVYKGLSTSDGRVVIKICSKSEASIYKRLSKHHPLFPKVYCVKEDKSGAIVVMEDIKGLNLHIGRLSDNQVFPLIEACWIMANEGVHHKDFGCNTFTASNRPIVILDFGQVIERKSKDHVIEDFQGMLFNRRHALTPDVFNKIKSSTSLKEAIALLGGKITNKDGIKVGIG